MTPKSTNLRLRNAVRAADELAQFVRGKSFDDYMADILLRRGAERSFEVFGESIGRAIELEPALGEQIPEARAIIGMRNRIAHGYEEVNDRIVWDAVTVRVPETRRRVMRILGERKALGSLTAHQEDMGDAP